MQTIDLVKKIVEALEYKKAEDITVLDIGEVSSIADYFIIAGNRQLYMDSYGLSGYYRAFVL